MSLWHFLSLSEVSSVKAPGTIFSKLLKFPGELLKSKVFYIHTHVRARVYVHTHICIFMHSFPKYRKEFAFLLESCGESALAISGFFLFAWPLLGSSDYFY